MKESIGYTLTLNIAIAFIIIIFVFLSNIVIYYKGYKVSNMITSSIEKYEGFNDLAYNEIESKLSSIGYSKKEIDCKPKKNNNNHKIVLEIQGYRCFMSLENELQLSNNSPDVSLIIKDINDWIAGYSTYGKFANDTEHIDSPNWLSKGGNGESGYCVYKCIYGPDKNYKNSTGLKENEYFYIVKTNMFAEIPLINNFINYSIYSNTNILYDFEASK